MEVIGHNNWAGNVCAQLKETIFWKRKIDIKSKRMLRWLCLTSAEVSSASFLLLYHSALLWEVCWKADETNVKISSFKTAVDENKQCQSNLQEHKMHEGYFYCFFAIIDSTRPADPRQVKGVFAALLGSQLVCQLLDSPHWYGVHLLHLERQVPFFPRKQSTRKVLTNKLSLFAGQNSYTLKPAMFKCRTKMTASHQPHLSESHSTQTDTPTVWWDLPLSTQRQLATSSPLSLKRLWTACHSMPETKTNHTQHRLHWAKTKCEKNSCNHCIKKKQQQKNSSSLCFVSVSNTEWKGM